jgi:hypothetical protein
VTGENKGYSRDYEAQWPPMRGRIRVKLFDADGKPTNPEITTRKELFVRVAELIPKMTSRQPGYVDPQQVPEPVYVLCVPVLRPRSHRKRYSTSDPPIRSACFDLRLGVPPFAFCSTKTQYLLSAFPDFRTRCIQAALGAGEAKIAGALKKNTGGSNKKKKGRK